ncbi:two-partner secretion domain-containing protein [Leptothoe kymatousa]|uniref:Filamentous hemagglutinin N-terminal domain-containing protein n=1 Tax=Leptothoe kymatousa TAU-MAC 1615 TaxID=2364775 RepID=A0ABS5Y669_9CYAN|nr:filamentous hemagglutinin N-terminal domain-containing protein [Leptothoe kymatousa]MBT9313338.1 filamentous hemagglutinin N-terminal domain-containing protein [Leptothoe kymatousa TAU-MAC 1615]
MPARAQVIEDNTVGTVVSGSGPLIITGGTQQLTTLFHSFSEFSPNANNVTFALDGTQAAVDTVIGRVTGNNGSFIDGQLSLTGGNAPDLFLLNPNGMVFGPDATLALPASFVATTAESVLFEGGLRFSANTAVAAPLLTLSTPVGLQFGNTAAPMHFENVEFAVDAGQAMSLVGGAVTMDRSGLTAPGGRLQVAGLAANSTLSLDADGTFQNDNVDIIGARGFRNVLIEESSFNVSGTTNGSISLMGNDTTLSNVSLIANGDLGAAGSIDVKAAGALTLNNNTALSSIAMDEGDTGTISLMGGTVEISSGFVLNETRGAGNAGGVDITANTFSLDNNAAIRGESASLGNASNIIITAEDVSIQNGGITSDGYSDGRAGDITINASASFYLGPGGFISSRPYGAGRAGDLTFMAANILLDGVSFRNDAVSSGDAGNITMTASDSLVISQSGFFNGTESSGDAGNITMTAGELTIWQSSFGSNTFSSGDAGDIYFTADELTITQSGFGTDTFASGDAGTINIVAGNFLFEESGFGASTNGTGRGGSIQITANNFTLRDAGFGSVLDIDAQDTTGGDIIINVNDTMFMERAGLGTDISGQGVAGNLTVNAHKLIMVESGVGSDTFSTSDSGILTVRADSITMTTSSLTSSAQQNSTGNSGRVDVIARSIVLDESLIRTTVKNTNSSADGGQINVQADTIVLRELDDENRRASIESQNLGNGSAGDISIIAREIDMQGGLISTAKFGSGGSSNLDILVDDLTITNGGSIFAANGTGATGVGNNVHLVAEYISLDAGSAITVSTGGEGEGGLLQVTANTLDVLEGAQISSSSLEEIGFTAQQTFAFAGEGGNSLDLITPTLPDGVQYGPAGLIIINANDINVQGIGPDGKASRITAFSQTNGNAGAIVLDAGAVELRDGGEVTVSGINGGNAGNLAIAADSIVLSNNASLRAETAAGNQGNIDIYADRYVVLNRGSQITTNATNGATGGNILITTPILLGYDNSDITANAIQGNGGNINIATRGLLGLDFRDQLTIESDITASSEFGLEGVVAIQPIVLNPEAGLAPLPSDVVDAANQIVAGCMANTAANFVVTGRGGLSIDPRQSVAEDILLHSFEVSSIGAPTKDTARLALTPERPLLQEATIWGRNAEGDVTLMTPAPVEDSKGTCLSSAQSWER